MKSILIFLLGLTVSLDVSSQTNSPVKKPADMEYIPSGSIKGITMQGFYMSNEITNKEYREFVNYLKQHPNDSLFMFECSKN